MKFFVNDRCIGCGMCASICPEVFELTPEGVAHAAERDVVSDLDAALDAQASCPTDAIETT